MTLRVLSLSKCEDFKINTFVVTTSRIEDIQTDRNFTNMWRSHCTDDSIGQHDAQLSFLAAVESAVLSYFVVNYRMNEVRRSEFSSSVLSITRNGIRHPTTTGCVHRDSVHYH
uniref:uncharacterized protein LOC127071233 n=1 Tax=Vespula vulgaris TaxID=7454 RepID=UPI002141DCFC|nr:uncharacterized protein LOC127071233 [Vespula vulgaris]